MDNPLGLLMNIAETPKVYSNYIMRALGYETLKTLNRHLPELYKRGFPLPLPVPGKRRWDAEAARRWLENNIETATPDLTAGERAALDDELARRAGEIAAQCGRNATC